MRLTSLSRWVLPAAVGLASVAASIVVPSLAISAYALAARDAHRIAAFALAIAEPLALVAALATTAGAALRTARGRARPGRWGVLLGVTAAGAMLGAARWVHDVDIWTAAAVGLLPLVGFAAARRTARPTVTPAPRRAIEGSAGAVPADRSLPVSPTPAGAADIDR